MRGRAKDQITPPLAFALGKALAQTIAAAGGDSCALGRDCRLSSESLANALSAGLRSAGTAVVDLGAVPSPLAYFAAATLPQTQSAVIVTASHNPGGDNGFKFVVGGKTLAGEAIQKLSTLSQGHFGAEPELAENAATSKSLEIFDLYAERVAQDVAPVRNNMRVVVDAGNSVVGLYAPKLYRALGCEVVELFCEPDGNFPNHHPDPSKPENLEALCEAVIKTEATIGLAFDGDGDRLGAVDEKGVLVPVDSLLMLFAQQVLKHSPQAPIIYDVKCSHRLAQHIKSHGGVPYMSRTGHSYIKSKLREIQAAFAGEMSGHFFFNDSWYGFDDALYSGARLLDILNQAATPLSQLLQPLDPGLATEEMQVVVDDSEKFELIAEAVHRASDLAGEISKIDGLRVDREDSWGVMRASNTSAKIILRFGGDTPQALQSIHEDFSTLAAGLQRPLTIPDIQP